MGFFIREPFMWCNSQTSLRVLSCMLYVYSVGTACNWADLTTLGTLQHLTFRILICLMVTFALYHVWLNSNRKLFFFVKGSDEFLNSIQFLHPEFFWFQCIDFVIPIKNTASSIQHIILYTCKNGYVFPIRSEVALNPWCNPFYCDQIFVRY